MRGFVLAAACLVAAPLASQPVEPRFDSAADKKTFDDCATRRKLAYLYMMCMRGPDTKYCQNPERNPVPDTTEAAYLYTDGVREADYRACLNAVKGTR